MKKLNFTITCCTFIFISIHTEAQHLDLLGGINFTGITNKASDEKTDESGNIGYHAGFAVLIPFSSAKFKADDKQGYALLPTIQYVKKGSSKNSVMNNLSADIKLNYLQFNLPLTYTVDHLDIGMGPYFSYAVSGSRKYRVGNGGREKIDFDNDLRRSDYGLGIQFTLYMFKFQYDFGLANIARTSAHKASTRSFSIGLNIPIVE